MDAKAAKKSIKPILFGLVAILVIVGAVWFFFIRGKNNDSQPENEEVSSFDDVNSVTEAEFTQKNLAETIGFNDYTAMFTFSKAVQNGQKTGEIVEIEGLVSHKTSSYSVVQENPKKAEEGEMSQIGTVFTIKDGSETDYPADGKRVKIMAKVMEVSPLNFQLVTFKKFVNVVE